jgi:hypothetical protein
MFPDVPPQEKIFMKLTFLSYHNDKSLSKATTVTSNSSTDCTGGIHAQPAYLESFMYRNMHETPGM